MNLYTYSFRFGALPYDGQVKVVASNTRDAKRGAVKSVRAYGKKYNYILTEDEVKDAVNSVKHETTEPLVSGMVVDFYDGSSDLI